MKIDFVIPHCSYANLRKTILSVKRNTRPENLGNIIVVDQNPTYQEIDDLVDLHVYTKKQLGFAKAVNTGMRLAESRYVAAWNDDCECINPHWVDGIIETFARYDTVLGVNPSSFRVQTECGAGEPRNECEYKEDFADEEYEKLVKEHGNGWVVDGVCTYATIYDMEKFNKLSGTVPGKLWYDEYFWPAGSEDYDVNRRAYMNGMRMLETRLSYVWHWWYGSNKGKCNGSFGFTDKWGSDASILGSGGIQEIPENIERPLKSCPLKDEAS